jgi:chlorobactene glucosyltransferase
VEAVWVVIALLNALLVGVVAIRAERRYRQIPSLPVPCGSPDTLPTVSVIIPARDESAVIQRVVTSLRGLDYPAAKFSLLVVDDHSGDATADLAASAGASVLRLESDPPPGWTGKCHASHQAAAVSNAEWLLFTDADTCHAPGSLRSAVEYAQRHGVDALSLLLQQECVTVWDKLALPLAYQAMFAALSAAPTFNGQYILIRREVYAASGGYALVRNRVMEDVALAGALAAHGYRITLVNGSQAASVRMYQSLPALLRGMTKTSFTAARDSGLRGLLLALPFFLGVWMPLLVLLGLVSAHSTITTAALLPLILTAVSLLPWLRRFHVPAYYALLSYSGLALLWAVGLVSTTRGLLRLGVRWKGRAIHDRLT